MKIFPDTNVFVSSFAFPGITRDLVAELMLEHEIFVSDGMLRELRRTLIEKLYQSPATVDTFISEIRDVATIVEPPFERIIAVRDPDDVDILAAAIKANADALVTGDKDLLEIANPPIRIVSPRKLYDELAS